MSCEFSKWSYILMLVKLKSNFFMNLALFLFFPALFSVLFFFYVEFIIFFLIILPFQTFEIYQKPKMLDRITRDRIRTHTKIWKLKGPWSWFCWNDENWIMFNEIFGLFFFFIFLDTNSVALDFWLFFNIFFGLILIFCFFIFLFCFLH